MTDIAVCNCRSVVRLPDIETQNGKYPMPNHAPMCNMFVQEKFAKVCIDKTCCVVELNEVQSMIDDKTDYEISDVYLTRDQFEKMKDFGGF